MSLKKFVIARLKFKANPDAIYVKFKQAISALLLKLLGKALVFLSVETE